MSFWTRLFGADNIVNKVSDGIDAAIFTKEEAAKHYLDVLKNIEPFKIAQRWLAVLIIGPYVLTWLGAALLIFISAFSETPDALLSASKTLAADNNDTFGLPVALIVGFYFAGGMGEGIIAKFKGK